MSSTGLRGVGLVCDCVSAVHCRGHVSMQILIYLLCKSSEGTKEQSMCCSQQVVQESERTTKKCEGRVEGMIKNQVKVKLDGPLSQNKSDAL